MSSALPYYNKDDVSKRAIRLKRVFGDRHFLVWRREHVADVILSSKSVKTSTKALWSDDVPIHHSCSNVYADLELRRFFFTGVTCIQIQSRTFQLIKWSPLNIFCKRKKQKE
jgi:hypothetical protein